MDILNNRLKFIASNLMSSGKTAAVNSNYNEASEMLITAAVLYEKSNDPFNRFRCLTRALWVSIALSDMEIVHEIIDTLKEAGSIGWMGLLQALEFSWVYENSTISNKILEILTSKEIQTKTDINFDSDDLYGYISNLSNMLSIRVQVENIENGYTKANYSENARKQYFYSLNAPATEKIELLKSAEKSFNSLGIKYRSIICILELCVISRKYFITNHESVSVLLQENLISKEFIPFEEYIRFLCFKIGEIYADLTSNLSNKMLDFKEIGATQGDFLTRKEAIARGYFESRISLFDDTTKHEEDFLVETRANSEIWTFQSDSDLHVFFLHGLFRNQHDAWKQAKLVFRSDLQFRPAVANFWGYRSTFIQGGFSIKTIAAMLYTQIRLEIDKGHRVALVGHSMGGIIALEAVRKLALKRELDGLESVILLAAPLHGSGMASLGQLFNMQATELRVSSDLLEDLMDFFKTDDYEIMQNLNIVTVTGSSDKIVNSISSKGPFQDNYTVDKDHSTIKEFISSEDPVLRIVKSHIEFIAKND